jgi:hypothetical protein
MSTLAITAAHFVAIPVRYAVGRWYNIPTNTLLAFNAAEIGLTILAKSIGRYYEAHEWDLTFYQTVTGTIVYRTCATLSALYLTSKLTDPMPLECAMMTTLASVTSLCALVALAQWIQGENNEGEP